MFQLGLASGTGHSIQNYRLGRLLGRGGFGYVYEARIISDSSRSGGKFAIKLIDKKAVQQSKMIDRVRNEVHIHFQLKHPSILELFDYFEDESFVYLVMELCENGELYRYMQQRRSYNRPKSCDDKENISSKKDNALDTVQSGGDAKSLGTLTEPEARGLMQQIISGLIYLHTRGIIHRDLKLSNLLLTDRNDIKIADFGLAVRSLHPDGEQKTMCGTPNYISPEIVSRRPYGFASDIWSLGCMLYTLLVGSAPFESSAVKNTLEKVSRADYHLPSSLSKEAQSVIREMLQKDPTRRISLTGLLEHPFFAKSILRLPKLLSGSGISETVPPTSLLPLSTERLRAISKRTKHAQAEITASGQLMLDFDGDKYRMVISGDGGTVKFFDNPEHTTSTPHQSSASSTDMWLFDKKPLRSYRLASLPQKFWKKYQYACRFVDAVKAKTPKIIFYSPQAKCMFMENGRMPNMEANFYQGFKLIWTVEKGQLEVKSNYTGPESIQSQSQIFSVSKPESAASITPLGLRLLESKSACVSATVVSLWDHTVECYRQCLLISQDPANESFPLVLKSSSTNIGAVPSSSSRHSFATESFSKPPSIYMSEVSSVGSGVSLNSTRSLLPYATPPPPSGDVGKSRPGSANQSNNQFHNKSPAGRPPIPPLSSRTVAEMSASPSPAEQPSGKTYGELFADATQKVSKHQQQSIDWIGRKYLDGVGWCIQQSSWSSVPSNTNQHPQERSDYLILFNDGSQLLVESPESAKSAACFLRFSPNHSQQPLRYKIDKDLPTLIKTRLANFPHFIQLYDA